MHLLLAAALALAVASPPNQREIAFTSKDGSMLAATLSWPAGSDSASTTFVLIGENSALAGVAAALNSAGLTVLRYDMRSTAKRQDDIDDVLAAVASLKNDPHVDMSAVYFLGRDEGGELAMGAAIQGAPVRGIVLLSPQLNATATIDPRIEVTQVTVPMLLLSGNQDGPIAAGDVKAFMAAAHDARRSLEYGDFDGDDRRIVAAIIAWLAETQ